MLNAVEQCARGRIIGARSFVSPSFFSLNVFATFSFLGKKILESGTSAIEDRNTAISSMNSDISYYRPRDFLLLLSILKLSIHTFATISKFESKNI